MPGKFWLPPSVTRGKPRYTCRLCGHAEHDPAAQARHVAKCYATNEGEIRMQSLREKAPALFGSHNVDQEFYDWHRKRGRTEV